MNKKLTQRLAIGLFGLAGLFLFYRWFQTLGDDPDFGTADTAGMIAAIEQTSGGAQAVVFQKDGVKRPVPGYKPGTTDREIVWRPDGNRLFVISDREANAFHIYRWNLATEKVERRSTDRRSKSYLSFLADSTPQANQVGLMTVAGFVQEFLPSQGIMRQVLPPQNRGGNDPTAGRQEQMSGVYGTIGQSFKMARWLPGRQIIVATMKREVGEVLIVQEMTLVTNSQTGQQDLPPPQIVLAANRIEFDTGATGDVVFTFNGFRFFDPANVPKEFIKNGKAVAPYRNGIVSFNPAAGARGGLTFILISQRDEVAIDRARISPDGSTVAAIVGRGDSEGKVMPERIVIMPATQGGASQGVTIATGRVRDVSWRPSGDSLAFTRPDASGKRTIYTVAKDGSGEKAISQGGDFSFPLWSPQTK